MQTQPLSRTPRPQARQHALADSFALAAVAVGRVLEGDSLAQAMSEVRVTGALRAAMQDLVYSALREYGWADGLLSRLTARPPAASLRGLLFCALVDLQYGPQSAHAVVHQAVQAAGRVAPRGGARAKGLVNGVLRNFLRSRDALLAEVLATDVGRYRHPQWWIDRVRNAWPQQWEAVLAAGNQPPPMTLRVNQRHANAEAYLQRLRSQGMDGELLGPQAVRLDKPVSIGGLPGFGSGDVSVQDWGAQQAAMLLDARRGMRVLDACAAPGGKAAHILEGVECELTAVDIDAARLARVTENLNRLGLRAKVLCADVLQPGVAVLAQAAFERILADVPCSASGVVRRHPDIKWLRRASDLETLATRQRAMLDALWRALAPGGKLLYATCSVFPEENTLQIDAFLAQHRDALRLALTGPAACGPHPGQILPDRTRDGFYYALLEKQR